MKKTDERMRKSEMDRYGMHGRLGEMVLFMTALVGDGKTDIPSRGHGVRVIDEW